MECRKFCASCTRSCELTLLNFCKRYTEDGFSGQFFFVFLKLNCFALMLI